MHLGSEEKQLEITVSRVPKGKLYYIMFEVNKLTGWKIIIWKGFLSHYPRYFHTLHRLFTIMCALLRGNCSGNLYSEEKGLSNWPILTF